MNRTGKYIRMVIEGDEDSKEEYYKKKKFQSYWILPFRDRKKNRDALNKLFL